MKLKIRKKSRGTYYIPSLSIKQLRDMSTKQKRRWTLTKDQQNIYLEAE